MQIRRRPPSVAVNIQALQYQVKTPDNEPRNILEKIVWFKEAEVDQMREALPLADLQKQVVDCPPPLDFLGALRSGKTQPALIAEVKKASPSKGVLRQDFNPVAIAQAYEAAGASCLSVLTDSEFFQGSFTYLQQIRAAVSIPLLCKEFILYPYQIYLARARGADAVLLIAAILRDQDLTYFIKIIKSLGMNALIEVHTSTELERVMNLAQVELIGINNRDLETFTVNLQVTCDLCAEYGQSLQERNILVVSESGLHTSQDVFQVGRAGAGAVLIGESLIKDADSSPSSSETERMQAKISSLFP
jgi:indole-3-glycerol phosphate synthase